ncbi:MAG: DUF2723 domain-containing protein [bacterium]
MLKWQDSRLQTPDSRLLYLFSFILGLSFTHHFQTIYLVPASLFFIIAVLLGTKKKLKTQSLKRTFIKSLPQFCILHFAFCIFLFILPLTLWAYLPIRSSMHPPLNWGLSR